MHPEERKQDKRYGRGEKMKGINDWCVVYHAGKCDHVLLDDVPQGIGTAYRHLAQPFHDKDLYVIPSKDARRLQEAFIPVDFPYEIDVSEPNNSEQ